MYTLKCTYNVRRCPKGTDASIERCYVQALDVGEQDKSAKAPPRPSDKYRTSVLYFLMLIGRTLCLTCKIHSRPTFVG